MVAAHLDVNEVEELLLCVLTLRPAEPHIQLVEPQLRVFHLQEVQVSYQQALIWEELAEGRGAVGRTNQWITLTVSL
jgi:hypothetical protein